MKSALQKRVNLQRSLHMLDSITNSKAGNRRCIIFDTILQIYKLKLKLEAIKREYLHLLKKIQEVKVEKIGENFLVKMTCMRGQNVLVSILETFEKMGLNVAQANVSSIGCFLSIEAFVEGREQVGIDERCIQQAVHKAIGKHVG